MTDTTTKTTPAPEAKTDRTPNFLRITSAEGLLGGFEDDPGAQLARDQDLNAHAGFNALDLLEQCVFASFGPR